MNVDSAAVFQELAEVEDLLGHEIAWCAVDDVGSERAFDLAHQVGRRVAADRGILGEAVLLDVPADFGGYARAGFLVE